MNLKKEIKNQILFPLEMNDELGFLLNPKKKILISGGSSLDNLYKLFKKNKIQIKSQFFLSDERIDKANSNLYKIQKKISKNINLSPDYNFENFSKLNYEGVLKHYFLNLKNLDCALLGFGTDGHICGLFEKKDLNTISSNPKSKFLYFKHRKDKFHRISISFKSLLKIKKIYLLINSFDKLDYLLKVLFSNKNKNSYLYKLLFFKKNIKFIYCA